MASCSYDTFWNAQLTATQPSATLVPRIRHQVQACNPCYRNMSSLPFLTNSLFHIEMHEDPMQAQ